MCSSLPAFAGFFRYHLPFLRSIRSRLGSPFRSFRFSKFLKKSIYRGSTEKISSSNVNVTLGSRVHGRGHFLNLTSIFGFGTDRSTASQLEVDTHRGHDNIHATRRNYYEEVESRQQPLNQYPLSSQSRSNHSDTISALLHSVTPQGQHEDQALFTSTENYADEPSQRSWWWLPRRSRARTGYWEVISVFRSKGPDDQDQDKELHAGRT